MTGNEIQAYAEQLANLAADHTRWRLEHKTPAELGYPGLTPDEAVEAARQHWIRKDPAAIHHMLRDNERAKQAWEKQRQTTAALQGYLAALVDHIHPPAADMVRRSVFHPTRRPHDHEEDVQQCLQSATASPALAIVHEDRDCLTLQIELGNDRAVVIDLSKLDGVAYTSVWTGSGEHELGDNSLNGWRQWLEAAFGGPVSRDGG